MRSTNNTIISTPQSVATPLNDVVVCDAASNVQLATAQIPIQSTKKPRKFFKSTIVMHF